MAIVYPFTLTAQYIIARSIYLITILKNNSPNIEHGPYTSFILYNFYKHSAFCVQFQLLKSKLEIIANVD